MTPTKSFNPEVTDGVIIKENQVTFIPGQRGGTVLVSNGYPYVRNRRSGCKNYWICAKKGSLKCNARIVTNVIDGVQKIVLHSMDHTHPVHVVRKKRGIKNVETQKRRAKISQRYSSQENKLFTDDEVLTSFNPEVIDGLIIKENQVTFTLGQRGCTLLVSNGYHYVRNRRSGYKTYWICAKKGSLKCNARVVTNIIDGVQKIVLQSLKHSHPVNVVRKKRGTPPKTKNEDPKKLRPKRNKNTKTNLFVDYGFEFVG